MKTKTTWIALLVLGLAIVMAACEPKPSNSKYGKNKNRSEVEKMLDKLIDSLHKETDWSQSQLLYSRIESTIESDKLLLRDNDKEDFHTASKDAFCYSMDNIMNLMMSGTCNEHTKLEEIWKKRTGNDFGSVKSTLYEQVKQQHKQHQDLMTFISNAKNNRQIVNSFNEAYDEQTEKTLKSKASTHIKSHPSCQYILGELDKIEKGTAFSSRRQAYCQKVVDLYLAKDSWNQGDENIVKSRMKFYTKDHSGDAKVKGWLKAIEDFKTEHQSN